MVENLDIKEFLTSFIQLFFVLSLVFFFFYGLIYALRELFETSKVKKRTLAPPPVQRRFSVEGDVRIKINDQIFQGSILNISESGMFIYTRDLLPKAGENLEFKILLPNHGNKSVEGMGTVKWVRCKDDFGTKTMLSKKTDFDVPKKFWPAGFGLQFDQFKTESSPVFTFLLNKLKSAHSIS